MTEQPPPSGLPIPAEQLALKQYESLRKEIENTIHQISTLDLYGILATGAVLTAMISLQEATTKIHPPILLGLPAVVAVLFYFRAHGLRKHIHNVSAHVAKLETAFGLEHLGWDVDWSRPPTGTHRGSLLDLWRHLFWIAIVLINLIVPFLLRVTSPSSQQALLPSHSEFLQQQNETLKRIESSLAEMRTTLTPKPKLPDPTQTIRK